MTSYNYSYNVLINRLEAFAAGHFLIKRFTHGQIDLADQLQDDQYPFMHVTPDTITPVQGGMQFGFMIMFADIPRDKEYKAEYQREVISDCVRLGQDLIAEVRNGLQLFGFDVQLVNNPTFEPFIEEYKNTVTGVAFTIQLEVPWDWSACDIPAVWTVGGASSGGSGTGYGITLRTNGVDNAVQNILDLVEGTNITITDNGDGSVTIDAAGGGGGGGEYVSTEWNANHTTAQGNPYQIGDRVWYSGSVYRCIANNDGINPSNPAYWTLQSVGYRLRQTPVDWNASTGDYQILNKPAIPTTLEDLLAGNAAKDLIQYDGTQWVAISGLTIDDLLDVSIGALSNNDALIYNTAANEWQNTQLGTVAYSNEYADLNNLPTIPVNLDDLADVDATSPATGDVISWNGVVWRKGRIPLVNLSDVNITSPSNGQVITWDSATNRWIATTPSAGGSGTVTSVGLTMPSPSNAAFSVSGSPVTTSGTLAVAANGTNDQYIDGTGALRTFPSTGGGGGQIFYFNGNVSQGTIGGNAYYELGTAANTGPAANFTASTTGAIARFITDVGSPNHVLIPAGVWTIDVYLSETGAGANHAQILAKLYTYNGSTFTLVATSTVEEITNGNVPDLYSFTISVPTTVTAATDRVHIEFDIQNTNGKTVTLYTEDGKIGEVHTTYAIGLSSLNGLTESTQNFAVGTSGTDFAISSAGSTHTFNLPTASAANRGALSSADWSTFNAKEPAITAGTTSQYYRGDKTFQTHNIASITDSTTVGQNLVTLPNPSAVRYLRINAGNTVSALTLAELKTDLGLGSAVQGTDFTTTGTTYQNVTGLTFAMTSGKTYKWRATLWITVSSGNGMFSTNGPSGTTIYRYTIGSGTTTNVLNNGTANNTGTAVALATNRLVTADGIYVASANGTFNVSMITSVTGGVTVKAGSVIEFEEVL